MGMEAFLFADDGRLRWVPGAGKRVVKVGCYDLEGRRRTCGAGRSNGCTIVICANAKF
jgi:hypothetical protein